MRARLASMLGTVDEEDDADSDGDADNNARQLLAGSIGMGMDTMAEDQEAEREE